MKNNEQKKALVTTRRQLLTLMGFGALCYNRFDPIRMLAGSLVDGLIANAEAQGTAPVKNFVSILFPGAPTRWVWDGFLNLNNESIVANASVNNYLTSNSYAPAQSAGGYRAELVTLANGINAYLPPLWNRAIPVSTGGTVLMKSLLNNTLIMRGVDMQADLGHVVGPGRALFPISADASLTGLVGDASSSPLPVVGTMSSFGINYGDPINQGYKSLKGVAPTLINTSTNALSVALSPFINSDQATLSNAPKLNSPAVQNAIRNSLTELGNYTKMSMPGSDVLYNSASKATQLFQTAFGNLQNEYTQLVNKYSTLASACAHTAIPNILPSNGITGYDLAAGTFTDSLSHQFAIAEYLLVHGYTSAISMSNAHHTQIANIFSYSDEHDEVDRPRSVICQSFCFLALSAMVYELRRVLIANSLWDKTLIHITSEYNRSPRNDGSGSDHSPSSNVVTMMSGAITQPIFIGNILTNIPNNGAYSGTYGVAAPVQTDGGLKLFTVNTAASTAAAILGVQNPVTQSASVVSVNSSGTGVTSLAEPPKNI